jgi:fibronectin type 3 domain-containing protein
MMARFFKTVFLWLFVCGLLPEGRAQTALDMIIFGNSVSENAHSFSNYCSILVTNTAVSPAQTARRCTVALPTNIYGGSLTFALGVDPSRRNYFTCRFWGGDEYYGDINGRLYLYVPASQFIPGSTNHYQIGYRHEGDYMPLNVLGQYFHSPVPGRFFYSTTLLPLWMTRGRTNLTFKIVSTGRIYPLGSGDENHGGNYQFNMATNSRSIYCAYTHTEAVFVPAGETQGAAPATTTRTTPTEAGTINSGGTFFNNANNWINNRLSASSTPANYSPGDVEFLARAYSISGLNSYSNSAVVTKVLQLLDIFATENYTNSSAASSAWGGKYGPLGWAIHLLLPQLQGSLDATNTYSVTNVTRRRAWGDMLLASREFGRFNRKTLSNQVLINDENVYQANRGLLDLTNLNALAETNAQRYLREAIGLAPYLGSDLAGGGSALPYGTNYFSVTPKGLTREWGYLGKGYGELQWYAANFYTYTGDAAFRDQCVKMLKARAPFRRPTIEQSGSANYRSLEAVGLLAWRAADESDGDYSDAMAYCDRADALVGMRCAAITLDTNAVGYAKQMLLDGQFFNNIQSSTPKSALDLETFVDYKTIKAAPDSGIRLPMTDGQPDFVWSDEDNGIVAVKRGGERLWLETYWQAKAGSGVNGVGRFHYSTTNYDQYGTLENTPQINFSGTFFVRTANMDKPEANLYVPYDHPLNAYEGERLPVAATDPLATSDEPFRGKALFWACRYGNFLIGINRSQNTTYQLQTPADFISATNLVTGQNMSGAIYVAPRSTVVLFLPAATDPCPPPQAPLALNASGDATPRVVLDWNAASGATGYKVKRAASGGGPYATIANVATTNYTDTGVTRGVSYFYVVSATNSCGESYYNSMEDVASGGLPSPWLDTDIGGVGVAGSGNYNNGTFTISGEGADIGSASDSGNLGYMTMTNNGALIARLASTGTGGKVGLMFRESTNSNSKMAAVLFDVWGGIARFPTRNSAGGNMSWIDGPVMAVPQWFKLQRSGNTYSGYTSEDGASWTGVGTNTFTMNSVVLAGLAVCSRVSGALNLSTFDNVSTPAWFPPPAAPKGLTATVGDSQIVLSWNSSSNAAGYTIKRATVTGGPYSPIAGRASTNYTDAFLTNGITCFYVVTATNAAGESQSSSEAGAIPNAVPFPPDIFTAVPGDTQVVLAWSPVTNASGYFVERATTANGLYLSIAANIPGVSFTNTGLNNGILYYFAVSATNSAGLNGKYTLSARPTSSAPPRMATAVTNGQIVFDWPLDHTGWQLQSQTNSSSGGLGTNWTVIQDSDNTNRFYLPISMANGIVFFRLVHFP